VRETDNDLPFFCKPKQSNATVNMDCGRRPVNDVEGEERNPLLPLHCENRQNGAGRKRTYLVHGGDELVLLRLREVAGGRRRSDSSAVRGRWQGTGLKRRWRCNGAREQSGPRRHRREKNKRKERRGDGGGRAQGREELEGERRLGRARGTLARDCAPRMPSASWLSRNAQIDHIWRAWTRP
jgi:hypothetical protein